jgi:uncharacterized protein with NRDE domain
MFQLPNRPGPSNGCSRMCLLAVAIGQSPRFPWVLASNRDEFFARPTEPLSWWTETTGASPLLGGRDLLAGGTWLGLSAAGRLALVTNVRDGAAPDPTAPSRGALVRVGLEAGLAGEAALDAAMSLPRNGFNLLLADLCTGDALWASNRVAQRQRLGPGVFGLSNAALDTPWPKLTRLKRLLAGVVDSNCSVASLEAAMFAALADRSRAPDDMLPTTGVPVRRERELSSTFIRITDPGRPDHAVYGTRCSTLVIVEQFAEHRAVRVVERRFDDRGGIAGQTVEVFECAGSTGEGMPA